MSNPFASPEVHEPFRGQIMRIKRVSVLLSGVYMAVVSPCVAVISVLVGLGIASASTRSPLGGFNALGVFGGMMLVSTLFTSAVVGFISGMLYGFIYNVFAGMTGGIAVECQPDSQV
jgi:hypothetical protein